MSDFYLVVLDIGQASTKIGFGGESEPRVIFPTITGKTKYQGTGMESIGTDQLIIGKDVLEKIGMYKTNYPIDEAGAIKDWDEYKAIIQFAFESLGIPINKCRVLFAANPFIPVPTHQRIAQLFLDEFNAGGYYPIRSAILSLTTAGKETGLIIDIGSFNTRITPIYKGYILKQAIQIISIGGSILDRKMMRELAQKRKGSQSRGYLMKARQVKEQTCFVSLNYEKDLHFPEKFKKGVSFPDSSGVEVDKERFSIPEQLFHTVKHHEKQESLVSAILTSVEACDVDIRSELLQNILITGGTASIPLMDARLTQEIQIEYQQRGTPKPIKAKTIKNGPIANWVGGANIVMLPAFQSKWLTKQSYHEQGLPDDILAF